MPRVTQAHEQRVRERIVSAALQVFAERGFHRATMQDVVRASGLSVGAIYTYFTSKGELFLAGCDLTAGQSIGELAERLARQRSIVEKLVTAIGFFFDSMEPDGDSAPSAAFMVQAWAEADQEPAVRQALMRRRDQLVTLGQLLLREAIEHGDAPVWLNVEAMARAYTALLDGLVLERVEEGAAWRRQDAERRAMEVLELLLAAAGQPRRPELPTSSRAPATGSPRLPSLPRPSDQERG